jgi:acyl-CoA thioester hydrolase
MEKELGLGDFHFRAVDKLRYADTDRQGHVNNAVFATMLETGRCELLFELTDPGSSFVVARLVVEFRAEVRWPGTVSIGTRVGSIGRSSIKLEQGLFQDDRCVATAETVIVLVDDATRKSRALPAPTLKRLEMLSDGDDFDANGQAACTRLGHTRSTDQRTMAHIRRLSAAHHDVGSALRPSSMCTPPVVGISTITA